MNATALEWLQFTAAVAGGVWAIKLFQSDVRRRQTAWLFQLFEKFYEKDRYSKIRTILDHNLEPQLTELKRQIAEDGVKELEEQFSDYLNFFEFIYHLRAKDGVSRRDIDDMFDYYFGNLRRHGFVRTYAAKYGFEGLTAEFARRSEATAK